MNPRKTSKTILLAALSLSVSLSFSAKADLRLQLDKETVNFPAPEQCQDTLLTLEKLFDRYQEAASNNKKKAAASTLSEIQKILNKTEVSNNGCFLPSTVLASLYFVRAFYPPFSVPERDNINTAQWFNLVADLLRQDRLVPLTETNRNKLGGAWLDRDTKKKKDGPFKIMGAYDCASTKIYFDPYLAPFDIASILIHELDHLFRDKKVDFSQSGLTPREIVLLDELLSALVGGFYQVRMSINHDAHTNFKLFELIQIPGLTLESRGYQIPGDFNLYSRGGRLYKLMDKYRLELTNNDPDGIKYFPFSMFLQGPLKSPSNSKIMLWMLDMIELGYFDESGADMDKLRLFLSKHSDNQDLLPFVNFLEQKSGWFLHHSNDELNTTSNQCTTMIKAAQDNQLKGYIGLRLSNGIGSGGIDGVRPVSGLRPCLRPGRGF